MGWRPVDFWDSTLTDFWRAYDGFYRFHGGKLEEREDVVVPDPHVIAQMQKHASSVPPRKRPGAKIIKGAQEIEQRMRATLGD